MNFNTQRRTFATITRNGIAVLFACWLMGGTNLLKKEVEFVTGLTDKTTADALTILSAEGYIIHSKTGWSLTRGGRQMILAAGDAGDTETRNFSDPISNESVLNNHKDHEESNTNSDSEKFRVANLYEALTNAKIGEPERSRLMAKPGLTALHITQWAKIKQAETGENYKPGLLVWVLRGLGDNPPLPDDPDTEQRYKYVRGEFAKFVNSE